MKKGLKKVFAVGASAAVASLTLVGAFAYDLSDYPAPFVEDGVFNGGIVVGESAATSDVLGSIDIAASLQAAAKSVVSDGSSATATTVVEGGVLLEDVTGQDVNFDDGLATTLDDQDLEILEDGTLEEDDGSETDYEQTVAVGNHTFIFDNPEDLYDVPNVVLNPDSLALNFTLDFESSVNFTSLDNSESFEMFGKGFTVKNVGAGDDMVLYASEETVLVNMGESVEYDGHTIEIMGANSDGSIVHLSVDGETRSLTEGTTKTVAGVEVYVQEVFISNVAGESAAAKIFIGSEEYNLGSTSGVGSLEINDEYVEGVEAGWIGDDLGSVDRIAFHVDMTDIEQEDFDEYFTWLAPGETFVDPIFDFELNFAEIIPTMDDASRSVIEFDGTSSDTFAVSFENTNADAYSVDVFKGSGSAISWDEDFQPINDTTVDLEKDQVFIAHEDYATNEPITHLIEVKTIYSEGSVHKVDFMDVSTGKEYTLDNSTGLASPERIGDLNVRLTAVDASADPRVVTLEMDQEPTYNQTIFVKSGMSIELDDNNLSNGVNMTLTEDPFDINFDDDDTLNDVPFKLDVAYDGTANDEWALSFEDLNDTYTNSEGDDYEYGITQFGTFTKMDEDSTQATVYSNKEEMDMRVFLAPPTATVTTMESAGAGYAINPIALGLGILDVDATLGAKPMIVVGGPSVNDIAAELMGNPTTDQILETFQEGKSMIKWYETEQAMLVAGFNAEDTRAAAYVLAEYNDYAEEFSGTEMEVKTSEISQVVVN